MHGHDWTRPVVTAVALAGGLLLGMLAEPLLRTLLGSI
jgi:hypothetical protein